MKLINVRTLVAQALACDQRHRNHRLKPVPLQTKTLFCAVALLSAIAVSFPALADEHAATSHHHFHDIQHWVQVFESEDRAKWQKPDEVVKALALKPGQNVADIGAGTGYFTRRFAAAVAPSGTAIGLDVEPGMVDYMNSDAKKLKLANYSARVVKPDNPGLAPASMDVVFFCDALHHIDDRIVYLKRIKAALKPGGRVADVDFKEGNLPVGPPPQHRLARAKVIDEFAQAGYRLAREHDFLPYQYFLEFEPAR